ncbi:hypothetical protein GCM10008959_03590 [Deinococcus seoulensis]|uniref:Uncharacterized protein n=1 Tax=Deinococcus seoulensis TaxID=1837379 RepID=A0ABQ2RP08_9DEIO|nr:hypothetical protein [Deinococcus seoulensis]GGR45650.1 hypothetical protein GCM10008959_03590 [Deinococcus seoulensis]
MKRFLALLLVTGSAYALLLTLAPDFGPDMPGALRVLCALLFVIAFAGLFATCAALSRGRRP